jgi:hypothetical protein
MIFLFGENYYFIHVENRAAIQLQKHYLLRQTIRGNNSDDIQRN